MDPSHLRRLRAANDILASADYGLISARPDGIHARYQYFYSEDLWTATPLTDSDGKPRMEYICQCGVDRSVHAPDCRGLTLACVKFMRVKVDPTIENVYVLCTWLPPPSESSWANMYGSFRYYPREGRYVPIDINGHKHTLPYPPFETTARVVVKMVRDHETNKRARAEAQEAKNALREMKKTEDFTPPQNSKWQQYRDHFKDTMTRNGHLPGTKDSVSYASYDTIGGIPILRPNPITDSQLPAPLSYAAPAKPKPLIELAS